jgi:hypothetical protein
MLASRLSGKSAFDGVANSEASPRQTIFTIGMINGVCREDPFAGSSTQLAAFSTRYLSAFRRTLQA